MAVCSPLKSAPQRSLSSPSARTYRNYSVCSRTRESPPAHARTRRCSIKRKSPPSFPPSRRASRNTFVIVTVLPLTAAPASARLLRFSSDTFPLGFQCVYVECFESNQYLAKRVRARRRGRSNRIKIELRSRSYRSSRCSRSKTTTATTHSPLPLQPYCVHSRV